MSSQREAACPSCGAPIQFKVSTSYVVVCEYCSTAVARGDVGPEAIGKVAQLAESDSPLSVGVEGAFEGAKFTITGGAHFLHPAGGGWDEWYASFADGRWGWIAEAQGGRFYLTFAAPEAGGSAPSFDDLSIGQALSFGGRDFIVAERAVAQLGGVKGELPWRPSPGASLRYADLSGPGGTFGTIDYSSTPPEVYLGRELSLATLGLAGKSATEPRDARRVDSLGLKCPQCGGPVALRAPDSQRVTCPQCTSLLDVNEQKELRYLEHLKAPSVQIDIGAQGSLRGTTWTVLGMLERSTIVEGERYTWEEYLLYDKAEGSRWLVWSDGEWSFVTPVPPGEVEERSRAARHGGSLYQLEQRAQGRVEVVYGEFPWRVQRGETVDMADYERGRQRLSKEWTRDEVNWSRGEPISKDKIITAFGPAAHLKGFSGASLIGGSGSAASGSGGSNIAGCIVLLVALFFIFVFAMAAASSSGGHYSSGGSFRGSSGGGSFGSHGGK